MESKNKKEELEIRKASSYDINFPDNKYLENSDKQRIQKAVTDGGISIGNKTFISEKELNKLLVTDRKGVTNAMMSTPPGDLKKVGDVEYMSTPHLQKEISQKRQQPRSITEQEKLGYAQDCVNAFSNNEELSRQRAIEADLITKQRAQLGKKVIKERKSKVSELSGKPLDGMAEVHHKDRVADKPERAFDPTNLAVIRKDEHSEYHNSDYPQNEKGYEQFENITRYQVVEKGIIDDNKLEPLVQAEDMKVIVSRFEDIQEIFQDEYSAIRIADGIRTETQELLTIDGIESVYVVFIKIPLQVFVSTNGWDIDIVAAKKKYNELLLEYKDEIISPTN